MNASGDAAEQIVRMSLEGVEVAAKITGEGAKNLAIMIAAILKEEQKTKGKARLSNLLKSGKELSVFAIQGKDLKKFSQEAKRYGVLYCVVKSKYGKEGSEMIDVIARAEDAPKINRIVENFKLATIDKAKIISEVEKDVAARKRDKSLPQEKAGEDQTEPEKDIPEKNDVDKILDDILGKPSQKEAVSVNPDLAKTEKNPRSELNLIKGETDREGSARKPSVREKLNEYKAIDQKQKEAERGIEKPLEQKPANKSRQTVHKQPRRKRRTKER